MIIIDIELNSPVLQETLSHAPEMTVSHEELYQTPDGVVFQFWAEGGNFIDFEDGLSNDSTVADVIELAETGTRCLYRAAIVEEDEEITTIAVWPELDISLLDLTGTQEGWELELRMPDRETLQQYREVCENRNIQFQLDAIYEESDAKTQSEAQLTNQQLEALITARECGYYKIPRQSSLADVADQCGISSQAASERLRRGTMTLIDTML